MKLDSSCMYDAQEIPTMARDGHFMARAERHVGEFIGY